jgi:hypothetical protein
MLECVLILRIAGVAVEGSYYSGCVGLAFAVGVLDAVVFGNELAESVDVLLGVVDVEGSDVHFSESAGDELGEVRGEVELCWEEVECCCIYGWFGSAG